ncbi:hypothetical protein [sulfur-oxidizing endosymbiont of Gigantopelta aegis]|uniref:hypothetical protein n=1 Tax=sulfur-oxidizing endosymbiont of Gigantopelta aegis TaxID=2794934 RepID=UPI0018DE6F6E|nr:hypothetical protein [sulfur-oxidizing endosymbiont of Gigantopelta aegis]
MPELESPVFAPQSYDLDVFHSAEDIIQMHDESLALRADAFRQLTDVNDLSLDDYLNNSSLENKLFSDNSFELELSKIKACQKVDVFIEEFEQLIANLAIQKPVIDKKSDNLGSLVQFKISIHLIKLLSEMVQASHLNHYSLTIIEFLQDIIDGRSSLSTDTCDRLSSVVRYYDRYNFSVKI